MKKSVSKKNLASPKRQKVSRPKNNTQKLRDCDSSQDDEGVSDDTSNSSLSDGLENDAVQFSTPRVFKKSSKLLDFGKGKKDEIVNFCDGGAKYRVFEDLLCKIDVAILGGILHGLEINCEGRSRDQRVKYIMDHVIRTGFRIFVCKIEGGTLNAMILEDLAIKSVNDEKEKVLFDEFDKYTNLKDFFTLISHQNLESMVGETQSWSVHGSRKIDLMNALEDSIIWEGATEALNNLSSELVALCMKNLDILFGSGKRENISRLLSQVFPKSYDVYHMSTEQIDLDHDRMSIDSGIIYNSPIEEIPSIQIEIPGSKRKDSDPSNVVIKKQKVDLEANSRKLNYFIDTDFEIEKDFEDHSSPHERCTTM